MCAWRGGRLETSHTRLCELTWSQGGNREAWARVGTYQSCSLQGVVFCTWTAIHPKCLAALCRIEPLMVQVTIEPPGFTVQLRSATCSCSQIQIRVPGQELEHIVSATEGVWQAAATLQRASFAGAIRGRPCCASPACLSLGSHTVPVSPRRKLEVWD